MDSQTARAVRLESLLPQLARTLFRTERETEWTDLPVAQIRVMRLLFAGASTASDLSESLGLSVSAVTQVVNRLETLGYVDRTEDRGDRRVRHVRLTELGNQLMSRRHKARVEQARLVLSAVPEERQEAIIRVMEELVAAGQKVDQSQSANRTFDADLELRMPAIPTGFEEEAS